MTHPRLPINTAAAPLGRRGRGAGKPAAHPVSPPNKLADLALPTAAGLPWLLDNREVARLLGVGRTKAFQLMLREELPIVRIGRCVRVPTDGLAAWIANRASAAPDDVRVRRV